MKCHHTGNTDLVSFGSVHSLVPWIKYLWYTFVVLKIIVSIYIICSFSRHWFPHVSPVQSAFGPLYCIHQSQMETVFSLPCTRRYDLVINLKELWNKTNIVSHHHSNLLSLISLAKGQGLLGLSAGFPGPELPPLHTAEMWHPQSCRSPCVSLQHCLDLQSGLRGHHLRWQKQSSTHSLSSQSYILSHTTIMPSSLPRSPLRFLSFHFVFSWLP